MTKDLINQRDIAREVWGESGYDYSVLTENNLVELIHRIRINLDEHRQRFNMRIHYHRNGRPYNNYTKNGRVIWVEITVDGDYFKDREGITFNTDGFVGFGLAIGSAPRSDPFAGGRCF